MGLPQRRSADMSKPKRRPARDYHEDLRVKPYATEDTPAEAVEERFKRAVRSFFRHDPPPHKSSKTP